jgi:thymidine kinase
MTPKEKAQELIAKFNNDLVEDTYVIYQNVDESKRCALIAVDEMMFYSDFHLNYLQEVKKEIENL